MYKLRGLIVHDPNPVDDLTQVSALLINNLFEKNNILYGLQIH